jgi:hypothetical protein
MSKETLNKANLESLGAPKLAELVQGYAVFYIPRRTLGPQTRICDSRPSPRGSRTGKMRTKRAFAAAAPMAVFESAHERLTEN